MLKQPLFGQDSSPHITSMLISAIATLVCWIIFCVMCFVIKFKPAVPEYKEIQIVLSSTPIADPEPVEGLVEEAATAEAAAPAEELAVAEPVEALAPAKPKETPKTQTKTQSQPAKTTTTQTTKTTDPSKKVDFDNMTYATDYSDFSFNNSSSSSSKSSFDWAQFEDSATEDVPVSQKVDKVTTASSISGSSGSTSNANQPQSSSRSSTNTSQNSTQAASSSTNDQIKAIQNTTGASTSSGTAAGSNDVQKFSSDLDINWNGGAARKAKGSLSINLTTGSSIKEKKTTVKIEFIVGEDGYVTPGSVKITPESLLPENVRKEVISQINLWRFNEGSSRSIATFDYTIIKKD